ncbi:glycosyltransferase family 4 protein [Tenacibaculum sp. S7007]|uniref:Glycosyltransferase family 4 protein n=1 Tax=Tenacibaculum pelagium TaxID=2759527 RepID=A0A839APJ7_9FLAO|nr:glycosyltransferase family 4 protein [Tenacibaculum pelagium]MBA6156300.1 glycosyltransferase family 4 protein [Tenacibaculum pelagium]
MKILFLTFYYEPDLSAGSFRNTSLFKELLNHLNDDDELEVITTHPNRYDSFKAEAKDKEEIKEGVVVNRIKIPEHGSGIIGQVKSYKEFYFKALNLTKNKNYDLVYASSSRLFTAYLGAKIARKKKAKLYLDIRDIFRETITDLYKNKIINLGLNLVLKPIENYTFGRAGHINLVSKGFKSYFKNYKKVKYSFFTNGIDELFLSLTTIYTVEKKDEVKTIVYGGNIGEGQGLDLIIPDIAKKLSETHKFQIIGDGGARAKLEERLKANNVENVEMIGPVSRNELIDYYQKADYLFLHLNRHKAFERVLPSKLFEYGTFNKPIIAGVDGYAKEFLKENMSNLILFEPTNTEELYNKLMNYIYKNEERIEFKKNFNREEINKRMTESIISFGND